MEKIASLKSALLSAIPALRRDPDKLAVFVDKGRMVARRPASRSLSWEYRYLTRLWFEGFEGGPDTIFLPLLVWLRDNEPALVKSFENDDGRITFAADIIDDKSTDILIAFELVEPVVVVARPDGSGWDLTHLPAITADEDPVADALLQRIFANEDLLVPLDPES